MDLKYLFLKRLNFIEYQVGSSPNTGRNYLKDIMTGKYDGIIIRNFFSQNEVQLLTQDLKKNNPEQFDVPHPGASTYPSACSSSKYDSDLNLFFQEADFFLNNYKNHFSVDFIEKTQTLLAALNQNSKPLIATSSANDTFLPGTFRMINSDQATVGLTKPHIGIEYVNRCLLNSYQKLADRIAVSKQLSFFTVLQQPSSGGEFTVFNFDSALYNEIDGESIRHRKSGKTTNLYSGKKYFETLDLKPGDAFIFPDFKTWHRVEPVYGSTPRISYGCWLGYDYQDEQLYFWS